MMVLVHDVAREGNHDNIDLLNQLIPINLKKNFFFFLIVKLFNNINMFEIIFFLFKRYMYNGIINVDNLDENEIWELLEACNELHLSKDLQKLLIDEEKGLPHSEEEGVDNNNNNNNNNNDNDNSSVDNLFSLLLASDGNDNNNDNNENNDNNNNDNDNDND